MLTTTNNSESTNATEQGTTLKKRRCNSDLERALREEAMVKPEGERTLLEIIRNARVGLPTKGEKHARAEAKRKREEKKNASPDLSEVKDEVNSEPAHSQMELSATLSCDFKTDRSEEGQNSKRTKSDRWSEEEKEKLEMGLRIFGTDFELLSKLLKSKSRDQIKNRFRKLEREGKTTVDEWLENKEGMCMQDFERRFGDVQFES